MLQVLGKHENVPNHSPLDNANGQEELATSVATSASSPFACKKLDY